MRYDSKQFRSDLIRAGINGIPKNGSWVEFAKFFGMDQADMNNMAIGLGYENKAQMEDDSPVYRLYGEMGGKFIVALMESSLDAHTLGKTKVKAIMDNVMNREIKRNEEE